ncbi:hypothetical protein AVEN_120820-1 [Araneus ventricosus]|uniref:Uncharacterized protein n=1 Tax=Araneus ventricosus TaxID=182803 RepID=A0A4Y2FDT6_ARAVE|nr:hypothetical protein AVEN_120820-1 [Araneus ventricosus]
MCLCLRLVRSECVERAQYLPGLPDGPRAVEGSGGRRSPGAAGGVRGRPGVRGPPFFLVAHGSRQGQSVVVRHLREHKNTGISIGRARGQPPTALWRRVDASVLGTMPRWGRRGEGKE